MLYELIDLLRNPRFLLAFGITTVCGLVAGWHGIATVVVACVVGVVFSE